MNKRVLFVDDEQHILDGLRRNLRKVVDVTIAVGGEAGLAEIKKSKEPFAVIVSDMRMPVMDGVEFLSKTKAISPDSVKLMLTGNADQETAVEAVNTGEVFKFLNKPCDQENLERVLGLALRQYQLITAEKELLNRTVKGSIVALLEVMSLVNPLAFGRVKRVRSLTASLVKALGLVNNWELDAAAMLSQLGCVSISEEILTKVLEGKYLTENEQDEYLEHPQKAFKLIKKIPRLENVAKIVYYQHKHFDGAGYPEDECKGTEIPLGARILQVALDFDSKVSAGLPEGLAYEKMQENKEQFDPDVLAALSECINSSSEVEIIKVSIDALKDGMTFEEDIYNDKGILLACRGIEVNEMIRLHLNNFRKKQTLAAREVLVSCPKENESENEKENESS